MDRLFPLSVILIGYGPRGTRVKKIKELSKKVSGVTTREKGIRTSGANSTRIEFRDENNFDT